MFGVSSEKAPCAKLTLLQAIEIRKEYNLGKISSIALAKKYNVSKKTILNILHNKTYIEPNK
jgi:Mor family transcriptional regulator